MTSTVSNRILVVDDDPRLCRMLERYLTSQGFVVELRHDGTNLDDVLRRFDPEVVLLDLGLPGEHGFEVARSLRKFVPNVGLVIISGSDSSVDKIVGLELGADDYVAKPFNERELLARIRSTIRRVRLIGSQPRVPVDESAVFSIGSLVLNMEAYEAKTTDNRRLDLTTHEFQILTLFARNRGRVLSRDQILDRISNRSWVPYDRSVDVAIGKVRKKLQKAEVKDAILTVRGAGYKFVTG
ncbi:MAG: response regulator transcription factor [Proteobacteria bacterium]|nr:response regulator transcription factor [Pseudomonadota bacterium]